MPEESLVLEKALGRVPHSGGKRFEPTSEYAKALLGWIQAGAPNDPPALATVESIEVFPHEMLLEGAGAQQQMIVRARYSDGSQRDVTSLALFYSNNDNSAAVAPGGLVTAANRGEAFVLARFDTKTVGSQAIVLPAGLSYTAAARAAGQLHRRAGERQAAEAPHPAQRHLHATKSSFAARRSTSPACCRPRTNTATS